MSTFRVKLSWRANNRPQQHVLNDINETMRLKEFKETIERISGIPVSAQSLRLTYPSRIFSNETNEDTTLLQLGISKDTVISVEENKTKEENPIVDLANSPVLNPTDVGGYVRRVVDADNSCLFNSIGYLLGKGMTTNGPIMREIIMNTILSNPTMYTEVFLGRPPLEYCQWIMTATSWGGEIELHILSQYYQIELVTIDLDTLTIYTYNQEKSQSRGFLFYDGIHYDPVAYTPSMNTSMEFDVTLFPLEDQTNINNVMDLAKELHNQHQYTNMNKFTLRCLICRQPLIGQKEATTHATLTGHQNYGEYRQTR